MIVRPQGLLRGVLQRVSLQAQLDRRDRGETSDGSDADLQIEVWQHQFLGALFQALPAALRPSAEDGERLILERAGLLFPRGRGMGGATYGYVHRLFQEYLAACELVTAHAAELSRLVGDALAESPGAWREVARFAVVRLAETHNAREAARLLCDILAEPDGAEASDNRCQSCAAAGLALEDLTDLLADSQVRGPPPDRDPAEARERFAAWFRRLTGDTAAAPRTRRDLGRIAGRLGDRRPRIVPLGWAPDPRIPFKLDPEQDFEWVPIPPGSFRPGSDGDEPDVYADELGGKPVDLGGFRISRYPVTQGQFAAFTRGGGYGGDSARPPLWWRFSQEAEDWWYGENPGLELILNDCDLSDEDKRNYERWIAQRPAGARRQPWFQDDPSYRDWVLPNHPVIGVSWFEAMAYCRWLTSDLRERRLLGQDELIRLPSEIEWERAARGLERYRWPWGNEWREGVANTEEAGLQSTTAVGLFPAESPEGLRDMAGNVWEWTLTRWGETVGEPDYGHTVIADDRDDPGGAYLRIVRGGAWLSTPRWCRGAYRLRNDPDLWYFWLINLGFRVVRVSPG